MAKARKLWKVIPAEPSLQMKLAQALGVSPVIAQILINRGIIDENNAREFLSGGIEQLHNPFLLKDMDKAVQRIADAIKLQQKITIYGDYDVDGITASALVCKVLSSLGVVVDYYIPERLSEGYGLNHTALGQLRESGTELLITVDCGISAVEELAKLDGGMDVIITDHHNPPERLPSAYAIINPKQPDCSYPDKNLAGVGVAFKLCQAIWRHQHNNNDDAELIAYLDIVAVGTVADIVPLVGENRIFVKTGLDKLSSTDNIGLRALIDVCGLSNSPIDTGKVGFVIAPRLNAAGRVNHASAGVELLLTESADRASELAHMLDGENARRQEVEKEISATADSILSGIDVVNAKVLVLCGDNWHPGVIGIVASRIVEKYYRPTVVISVCDGVGKGSCRSISGFDMYDALSKCADLLEQFGGHQQAAGLSIAAENIERFRERMNDIAASTLSEQDYIPLLRIDALLALEEIHAGFMEQLACLAPHGMGNPNPVFVCREAALTEVKPIGKEGKHLKMRVRQAASSNNVVAWNMGDLADSLKCNSRIDLAFQPEYNEWQGQRSIQLRACDVCQPVKENSNYDYDGIVLNRTIIGQVYLVLKDTARIDEQVVLTDAEIARNIFEKYQSRIGENSVNVSVRILEELGLLRQENGNIERVIHMLPVPTEKLDLTQSSTYSEYMCKDAL